MSRDGCTNGYADLDEPFSFKVDAKFVHRWTGATVAYTDRVFVTFGDDVRQKVFIHICIKQCRGHPELFSFFHLNV